MSQKNKKQKFSPKRGNNHLYLKSGMRGFLGTCNFREQEAISEGYNILRQYANKLYGEEYEETAPTKNIEEEKADKIEENDELDINDALDKNINAIKPKPKGKTAQHRFQAVGTGANNCVFFQTTLPDPVELGTHIVEDIIKSQEKKSRFLLRLVPIEVVCHVNTFEIAEATSELFDKHFLHRPSSYCVAYNKRNNNDVRRDDIIVEVAKLVCCRNIGNTVDLKQPEKTIVVEVIKGLCCIAVIEGYLQNKKYNLVELVIPKPPIDPKDL